MSLDHDDIGLPLDDDELDIALDNGDGIDYSEYFFPRRTFDTYELAFDYANRIALNLGFNLIKFRHAGRKNGTQFRHCVCEHYGFYSSVAKVRKNTTTKKCGCKFMIKLVKSRVGLDGDPPKWGILPDHGFHNHPLFNRPEGHRRLSQLSDEQKSFLTKQKKQHVSPAKMLVGLEDNLPLDSTMPSKRMVYNFTEKLNAEVRGVRNPAQQMLLYAREAGYLFYTVEDPETNELTRVFMAHPEAVKMFRVWPHVGVIDSTYRTNRYAMPLVEIVGVSPTGKNFVVAYVLVNNEKYESYVWVLERLRDLLLGGYPGVIVTDRELSLIKALNEVFPLSTHLLCVWHVYNAVEARALKTFRGELADNARLFARFFFRNMVQATSAEMYDAAWNTMRGCFYRWPRLLAYVSRVWKSCEKLWSVVHTNQVFHLGNCSTGRAESAHSLMKTWLGSSKNGCDTFWAIAHDMLKGQQREIRCSLQESISRGFGLHATYGNLFVLLRGKVSLDAIIMMREEFDRGVKLDEGIDEFCGCAVYTTHGLLCSCRLHYFRANNMKVHVEDIHDFWSTLSYEPPDLNVPAPNDALGDMIDVIRGYDMATQRSVLETLHTHIHPEDRVLFEPQVIQIPRGRPRTSTTRNLSLVERLRRQNPYTSTTSASRPPVVSPRSSPCSSRPPLVPSGPSRTTFDVAHDAPLEIDFIRCSLDSFPQANLIPAPLVEYFDAYYNPVGDGHCGFRCISSAALGDENDWSSMRVALGREIEKPVYRRMYVGERYDEFERIFCPPHVSVVNVNKWMVGVDLFGFATIYNWAICLISVHYVDGLPRWSGSSTFLPLRAPAEVDAPFGVLWLLLTGDHFMRIRFVDDPPMPTINFLWEGNHEDSVNGWQDLYTDKTQQWQRFFQARAGPRIDISDDDNDDVA